jgi:uncharacterized protein YjbJ (UPF0337 family)
MKFSRILEQYVRESEALTKIVVKVDPLNNSRKDYRDLDGYEGYILKEENDMWSILFENINMPIVDVPFSVIKVVDVPCDETFNNVRMFGLKAIEERKGLTMEIISKIQACNSIDFLEQYLKEEGLNDSEIKDVYKKALLSNTISENVLRTAGKITRGVGKVLGNVLQPDYAIAGLIKKGTDAVQGKKREILGNIQQAWGSEATDKAERSNTTSAPTGATSTPTGSASAPTSTVSAPPTELARKVDNASEIIYPRTHHLIGYFNSGGVSSNFKFYKNINTNSFYFHNTVTQDIIKNTPIPGSNNIKVQIGNLYYPAPDPNKSKNYFENQLPKEMASNNIRFLNRSLANIS